MPCLSAPSRRRRWVEKFASSWIGRTPPQVKLSTDINGRRDARLCHLEPPGSLGGFLFLVPGNAWPLSRVSESGGRCIGCCCGAAIDGSQGR